MPSQLIRGHLALFATHPFGRFPTCYIFRFLWFAAGLHLIWLAIPWAATTQAATVVVASVDVIARADLVCDGRDDEVELLQSLPFDRQ